MLIGAHMSASGGYHKAVERVHDIGGNALQIFSSSPRSWRGANISEEDEELFNEARKEFGVGPVYFHACYLINLADGAETGRKSVASLVEEIEVAGRVGVRGSVVHTGSYKTKDELPPDEKSYHDLLGRIKEVLKKTPKDTLLLLENSGTRKIGRDLAELAQIIKDVGDERLRVCLDTCHLHAAGYDLSDKKKFGAFLDEFDEMIGLEKFELLHVNDSRDPLGSLRDRHENISEGEVGDEVFKLFLNDKRTKHLPFISETPGFDGGGPDKENLDRLKAFVK